MSQFDVIVVGGGLVGAAQALALERCGLKVALLEQGAPPDLPHDQSWDARIYAVTPGNAHFLSQMGVWSCLDATRIAPIFGMSVWGDDVKACLEFDAYEAGVPELGFISESRLMQNGLWNVLTGNSSVEVLFPVRCKGLENHADRVAVQLEDGRELSARLIIGADGGRSWVRQQAGIDVTTIPYEQLGVVANFETEKPHGNIARQWFLKDGILAWLPLPGNRISIVWSAFTEKAQFLMGLNEEQFCQQVERAGHKALGALRLITSPEAFPLRLQRNDAVVAPRIALVGDAAHLVHPLAGQGVNLGFRDVQQLVKVLATRGPRDLGDMLLLRRYERARQSDILSMQGVTTGLQKLFNNHQAGLSFFRNAGLALTNQFPMIKRQLMTHALS